MRYPQLDLENWRQHMEDGLNTDSLWMIDRNDTDKLHQNDRHGQFVAQIPRQMILRFSEPGDVVADLMMGRGTTGIEARRMGRKFVGNDLDKAAYELAAGLINKAGKKETRPPCWLFNQDAYDLLDCLNERRFGDVPREFNLTLFHPPYHDIIKFTDRPEDISGCESIPEFYRVVHEFSNMVADRTSPKGHLIMVVGDIWDKDRGYVPLAHNCLDQALDLGKWKCMGTIVKNMSANTKGNSGGKDANLKYYRALKNGTVRFAHEYIFILKRNK